MNYEERRAFVAEYLAAEREASELQAYKSRYDSFRGFISQAECVRIEKSREPSNGKTAKYFFIVKKPSQPILVVKLPLYGVKPEAGDVLYWTQPKEHSDEVSLLAIKKPDGTVLVLKDKFKNAEGRQCLTLFFVEPQRNYMSVQVRLDQIREYLLLKQASFDAALEEKTLASEIKLKVRQTKKVKARSL